MGRQASTTDKGHGRREKRTLRTTTILTLHQCWPGLAQGFELTRERTEKGRTSVEVVYGITSLRPEQADAATDQEPVISQNFSWWNRRGTEVIRGHTTLLPVGKEILYVEPIFLRSEQNHLPQLKKVVVVMRGKPFMEDNLERAVRAAVAWWNEHNQEEASKTATPMVTDGSRPAA